MTPEELSAAVALVCGETRKFEVKKDDTNARAFRWKVTMWRKKRQFNRGAEPVNPETWISTGWCAHGPTQEKAMEKAVELALKWADAEAKYKESVGRMMPLLFPDGGLV